MTKATLYRIELELAREPGHPEGDQNHSYRFYFPLTPEGHIDPSAYRDMPDWCRVVRRRPGEEEARGRIVRGPDDSWVFDYVEETTTDDEVGFRLAEERFVVGEYVSIREDDGKMHVFRVTSVRPD
jgi:hypothetical protein